MNNKGNILAGWRRRLYFPLSDLLKYVLDVSLLVEEGTACLFAYAAKNKKDFIFEFLYFDLNILSASRLDANGFLYIKIVQ